MKNIAILGATGSIGLNTLDVIARHPEKYSAFAISARSNWKSLNELCIKHRPKYAILVEEEAAENLRKLAPEGVEVLSGESALIDIASHV